MEIENLLKDFAAGGEIPYNFSLFYTEAHALWGGTSYTINGFGRSVKSVTGHGNVNPQIYETEVGAEQLRELAALVLELRAWEQILPQRPLIPDEVLATLKITIGNPRGGIWERSKELEANNRLIRIREKMNRLFERVEPLRDENRRPDDLAERNRKLAAELLDAMQSDGDADQKRDEYEAQKESEDKAALADYYRRTGQLKQPEHVRYCAEPNRKGLTCREDDLALVRWLEDTETDRSIRVIKIFACKKCHGFYKYQFISHYASQQFDTETGWDDILNHYFKVEEEYVHNLPLPYEEAARCGYNGPPVVYASARCDRPPDFSGMTCASRDVFDIGGGAIYDVIKKCRRCGEFYKQVWLREIGLTIYYHYKPGENYRDRVAFPLAEALQYGYVAKDAN